MIVKDELTSTLTMTCLHVSLYNRPSVLLIADAYAFDNDFVHFYSNKTRIASFREVDIESIVTL